MILADIVLSALMIIARKASLIQFKNLTLKRGVKVLVEGASLQLHPGHKVGLTGANGAGKSSIFAMLRGELHPEAGDLEMPPSWVVGHVAQDTPALPDAAIEFALDGDAELRSVEKALAEAEAKHEGDKIGELHAKLGEIGGYSAKARAAALLDGLGFKPADLNRPVSDFSGGWRVRLNLARALMCPAQLLLLDEPTADIANSRKPVLAEAIKERSRRGMSTLIASHDREFIDLFEFF